MGEKYSRNRSEDAGLRESGYTHGRGRELDNMERDGKGHPRRCTGESDGSPSRWLPANRSGSERHHMRPGQSGKRSSHLRGEVAQSLVPFASSQLGLHRQTALLF